MAFEFLNPFRMSPVIEINEAQKEIIKEEIPDKFQLSDEEIGARALAGRYCASRYTVHALWRMREEHDVYAKATEYANAALPFIEKEYGPVRDWVDPVMDAALTAEYGPHSF